MPFSSRKQQKFMWSQHPEIARKWEREGRGHVQGGSAPSPAELRDQRAKTAQESFLTQLSKKRRGM